MLLYIHIPYCKGKCIYCDFYSGGNPDWKKYTKALLNELSERREEVDESLSSVYFGGGTPSLIPAQDIKFITDGIRERVASTGFSIDENAEITLEVNPEDVDPEKIKAWKSAGFNRISMGVQSLNDNELSFLKRRHNATKAIEAAKMLRCEFENLSLDLIYGLPGQTLNSLKKTIETFIILNPNHISAYELTYEAGTPLYLMKNRLEEGKNAEEFENRVIELSELTIDMLEANGYARYEISNFAKEGFESRHNTGYWNNTPYMGLGPSAASYDGRNNRKNNPADLKKYIEWFADESEVRNRHFYSEEKLSEEELRLEAIMLGLRTVRGINLIDFKSRFGIEEFKKLNSKATPLINSGLLLREDNYLLPTRPGFKVSDYIISELC